MKPLDPLLLPSALEISQDFHQRVKLSWKSLNDYIQKGKLWLDAIKHKYHEDSLISHAYLIYNAELAHFAGSNGLLLIEEDYTALIMKGGGIKGLAYVGALEIIHEHYKFNWFAGTSAGAIAAVLLACGYTHEDLKDILSNKNFNDFKDASFFKSILNLATKKGLYEAETFVNWLGFLLTSKLESSVPVRLEDLPNRTTVYASVRNKSALIYDSKSPKSKDVDAAFAARCSMSIPGFFTPQKSEGENVFDGGMQNNFPIKEMLKENSNLNFVAFYLGQEIYSRSKSSFFNDLINIFMESTDHEILRQYKSSIIIIDPSPISTLKFKLNEKEKEFLLESGRLAALKFLNDRQLIDKNNLEFNYLDRKAAHENNRKTLTKKYYRNGLIIFFLCLFILFELIFFFEIFDISILAYNIILKFMQYLFA